MLIPRGSQGVHERREEAQATLFVHFADTMALQHFVDAGAFFVSQMISGDMLHQDKIATLTAENNDLRRAASQDRQNALLTTQMAAQTQQIINTVKPAPIPAYQVPNPNVYYGCGCNTGCGC